VFMEMCPSFRGVVPLTFFVLRLVADSTQ